MPPPAPRINLIHATKAAITPTEDAFAQHWPAAILVNLLDDSLSVDLIRDGKITAAMTQRFIDLTRYAADSGAEAVLFTCSAFNRCIEAARQAVDIPVLKPDEAMIEQALEFGPRLGLLATFSPTMASTTEQIHARASALGLVPELKCHLVDGALAALQEGDGITHDRLIQASLEAMGDCDAVILAQVSMARATVSLDAKMPVLVSPPAAVEKLRSLLR